MEKYYGRNREIFRSFFGSSENSEKSFRNQLTFSSEENLQYYPLFSYKHPYLDVSFIRCKGEVTTKLNYKVITKAIIIDKKSFSLNETKIKSPLFRAGEKF